MIHVKVILPSLSQSSKWPISSRSFPHLNLVSVPYSPIRPTCRINLNLLELTKIKIIGDLYKSRSISLRKTQNFAFASALKSRYFPEHFLNNRLSFMLFPQTKRPCGWKDTIVVDLRKICIWIELAHYRV